MRIICCICLAALTACGYGHQQLYPDDVGTVHVPIFENRSFYQGVERELTEALINEIELRTPYKVVSRQQADTVLDGTITSVDQGRLSRGRKGGLPQELETRIRVNFEWRNVRTERTLRERRGFTAVGRYIPARPVGEPYQIAQHEAVQRLARDIVAVMAAPW